MWRTLGLVESLDTASGKVFASPFIKSCNRSFQCLAEFYVGVFDTHRRLGKDTPHYQPTSFKLSQALREHLLRYARHTSLQDVEARPALVVTQCVEGSGHATAERKRKW